MTRSTAQTAVDKIAGILTALPACIAGSAVASAIHTNVTADNFTDVDVFCYSKEALIHGVTTLLNNGHHVSDRHQRLWHRWLSKGIDSYGRWHTNSIKLFDDATDQEINLIYKRAGGQTLTSLGQVLESFDFGLLAAGVDLPRGTQILDMRSFMFPDLNPNGPLPLLPARREDWRGGFISQYQGLRELGRYAKYAQRGYDMTAVADDLVEGYRNAALYNENRSDPERQTLAKIYFASADLIEDNDLDEMFRAAKEIDSLDDLDKIMEALE